MAKKIATGKKQSRKCEKCYYLYTSGSGLQARYNAYSMNRLYIKFKGSWKAVGYYCKKCYSTIIDKDLTILKEIYRNKTRLYVKDKYTWKGVGYYYKDLNKIQMDKKELEYGERKYH